MSKVVVAMSGGVDSSVAAGILVRQGHQVTGMMLRLWSEPGAENNNRCCTPDSLALARRISAKLGIPFYAVDGQDAFFQQVVGTFTQGYLNGVTPNPCLTCNRRIRWGLLLDRAHALGADYLATGHYARIIQDQSGQFHLLRGVDLNKDQSYVLSVLNQEQLAHTLFPLGEIAKPAVRALAREMDLPVADRSESQDLCFLGKDDYRNFLKRRAPESQRSGQITDREGKVLGAHQGLAYYTIGQRKGLGLASDEALYVVEKDIAGNRLVVGKQQELGTDSLTAQEVNWTSGQAPQNQFSADVKIRYKAPQVRGKVFPIAITGFRVEFDIQLRDITPGQAAVLYNGEECLGGGIIQA
ncbi:MAG: tRNA 2-thiouridine(34) synthase MnmA [Anaerolineaceae bacterium]|nr:tRNA 2-thiouridine(34) synthase MnmA [Anaerolineaceae bacterium]